MSRRPRQTVISRGQARLADCSAIVCLAALSLAIVTLETFGAPPRFGLRAMWVRAREDDVAVLISALLVAGVSALVNLFIGRHRVIVVSLCGLAVVIAWSRYEPQVRTIIEILARHG